MIELPDFHSIHILVVGDVMLDRYSHGETARISPEAPVPVVRVESEEARAGGAGNVALNIAHLGGKVSLIGVTGDDEMAQQLTTLLQAKKVDCFFQKVPSVATITKHRIISRHQQLIRLDFEDGFPDLDSTPIQNQLSDLIDAADLVIFSDYAKGTLNQLEDLIAIAKKAGKPILIDPKGSDYQRYKGATLLTPNCAEFEQVVGQCAGNADIEQKGEALMTDLEIDAILITRGEMGMTLLEKGQPPRHLPARAREVFDVTGAGDTVISVTAAALAMQMPLEAAIQVANAAAGVVVAKLGTAVADFDEIQYALHQHDIIHQGIVSEEELKMAMQESRNKGESLVLTNGCFDILHAGHVTYLEQASRLGDRLIVAVNIDQTVRDLKGEERPVNNLKQRMTVLAALGCVDWVVPFSEPTPERLICDLKPDFLVKGGDNHPDNIPGGKCVKENGGEVRVMSFLDNHSTTNTINKIIDNAK